MRKLVARKIVINLIDRGSADLVAARPLLESVVEAVVQTHPFRRLFRHAAGEANRVFFVRDRSRTRSSTSATPLTVIEFAVRSVSPQVAQGDPDGLRPRRAHAQP